MSNSIIILPLAVQDCFDSQFNCSDVCIPVQKHCDMVLDCLRWEDEIGCRKYNLNTSSGEIARLSIALYKSIIV